MSQLISYTHRVSPGQIAILSLVIACLSTLISILSLWEMARTRRVSAMVSLVQDLHSEITRTTRRLIAEMPPHYSVDELDEETKDRIEAYIDLYNRVGFFCENKLLGEEDVLDLWSGTIKTSWLKLSAYVIHVRQALDLPNYGEKFEDLAERSDKYRSRRFGEIRQIGNFK